MKTAGKWISMFVGTFLQDMKIVSFGHNFETVWPIVFCVVLGSNPFSSAVSVARVVPRNPKAKWFSGNKNIQELK